MTIADHGASETRIRTSKGAVPMRSYAYFLCAVGFVLLCVPRSNLALALPALTWLWLRLNEVLRRPVDDLVKLLGLETPPTPEVSLLKITSTCVALHWKALEHRPAVSKYAVRVNGTLVHELPPQETSISITNLQPDRHYVVRVIAINSLGFQTPGDAIRIRTSSLEITNSPSQDASDEQKTTRPIEVVPYKSYGDATLNGLNSHAMAREHSGGHLHTKRSGILRRPTPSSSHDQLRTRANETQRQQDCEESIDQLKEKLASLTRETQEVEKQEEEEREDHQENSKSLAEKREALRQQLKDRDEESKELKKLVTGLERQHTAAQSKKTAQEKLLQQKVNERNRMTDETKRWNQEATDMAAEAQRVVQQQATIHETTKEEVESIKGQQQAEQDGIERLEHGIQEKKASIRILEEEKNILEQNPSQNDAQSQHNQEQIEDAEWKDKFRILQGRLSQAITECNHAQFMAQQAQYRFEFMNSRRGSQAAPVASGHGVEFAEPFSSEFENASRLNMNAQPFAPSFMAQNQQPHRVPPGSAMSNRPVPEFYPSSQRTPGSQHQNIPSTLPPSVVNQLTGGALTSPGADALLPSNLLGDDGDDGLDGGSRRGTGETSKSFSASRTNLGLNMQANSARQSSAFPNPLPGLGVVPGLGSTDFIQNPASPTSLAASRSPSLLSSPRASVTQLHQYKLSDSQGDSDRRSVRSMSTSSRPPKTSRMFGPLFNRQRGKTTSEDGPALGSLKHHESQSMPRQLDHSADTSEASGSEQRKAGTTSNFFSQMSSATAKPLSMFSSRANPWSRSTNRSDAHPLPSFPSENALPLPSADHQPFGWPNEEGPSRASSLRGGGIPGAYPSSLYSSKRQSIFEDTAGLGLEDIQQLDEDSLELPLEDRSPPQAPIGTKPSKGNKSLGPAAQLNPNARDFRSMFTRTKTSDKLTPKAKKKDKTSSADDLNALSPGDASPPESRKSKEGHNSSAADSAEDVNDSLNDSGVSTPLDGTPQSGSVAKASLMRRLTRKSSSTKFMSTFSKKSAAAEETDEDGTPTKSEKGTDSVTSSPQLNVDKRASGFSLASFKGRKKKGMDAPSISETSMASETGDEDDRSRPSVEE